MRTTRGKQVAAEMMRTQVGVWCSSRRLFIIFVALCSISAVHASAQNTFPANGNVGIGTTTPTQMLSIGDGSGASLGLSGINGTSYSFDFSTTAGNSLQIKSEDPGALPVAITGSGNVGIGTVAPGYNLDIYTPVTGASDTYSGFQLRGNTYGYLIEGGIKQGAGGILRFSSNNNGSISERMRLNQDGNVGIGTVAPGARLEVNGNIALTAGSGASITFPDATIQATAWNGVLTGGDYAESVNVTGDREGYEPGDVLVIDPDSEGRFLKSSAPYSSAVTGIYSTKPGVVGRRQLTARLHMKEEVPMAMTGIVPTKVSAENGPIKPGDLLVTSSKSGYAMKGTDRGRMLGAVIGKAIGHLDSDVGVIEAVVTVQ